MGACEYMRVVVSDDIYSEISKLSEECVRSIQDPQDIPYSGGINTIDFKRCYARELKSDADMYSYVGSRLHDIRKGEGEIVELGVEYYVKAYVDFRESDINAFREKTGSSKDYLKFLYNKFSKDKKFLLVDETGSYYSSFSSISDIKSYVNRKMLSEKFAIDYFILGKSNVIFCTGLGDIIDENIRPSNSYIVIPYKKYLLFGWAWE